MSKKINSKLDSKSNLKINSKLESEIDSKISSKLESKIDPKTFKRMLKCQQSEINGSVLYKKLAERVKDEKNKKILMEISDDEYTHYKIWKEYTKKELTVSKWIVFINNIVGFIMGYTFVIKRMENGEEQGIKDLLKFADDVPEVKQIIEDEEKHEDMLIGMLDEERLNYVGAIVLGLNDALVELTGAIAGVTFAFQNTHIIALSGIITGVAATLSMAASNFLAERANNNPKALKSSAYTGGAYLITVILLVLPFLLFPVHMYVAALITMLVTVILIIMFFNYYVSVAKSEPFLSRFAQMATISLGVAVLSFAIGIIAKSVLGINI